MSRAGTGAVLEFPVTVRTPAGAAFYKQPIGSVVYRDASGAIYVPHRSELAIHMVHDHGVSAASMTNHGVEELLARHAAMSHPENAEHRLAPATGKLTHVIRTGREQYDKIRAREARHAGSTVPFTAQEQASMSYKGSPRGHR